MFAINRRGKEPLYISLPDFNKGHRCPGWSGEGMRTNRVDWCNNELPPGIRRWSLTLRRGAMPRNGVLYAEDLPGFYSWRVRRTNCCDTIVLPQFLYLLTPGAWVYWDQPYVIEDRRVPGRLRAGTGWQSLYWSWRRLRSQVGASL